MRVCSSALQRHSLRGHCVHQDSVLRCISVATDVTRSTRNSTAGAPTSMLVRACRNTHRRQHRTKAVSAAATPCDPTRLDAVFCVCQRTLLQGVPICSKFKRFRCPCTGKWQDSCAPAALEDLGSFVATKIAPFLTLVARHAMCCCCALLDSRTPQHACACRLWQL